VNNRIRRVSLRVLGIVVCGVVHAQAAHPQSGHQSDVLHLARLSQSEVNAIAAIMFKDHATDCLEEIKSVQAAVLRAKPRWADLSGRAGRELIVRAADPCNCSPTGNCLFWVLRKNGTGFDVLLETDLVNNYSVKNSRTNGYRDLMTASHGSAYQSGLTLYKFDGKEYKASECMNREYELQEDGSVAKKPTITKVDCN
jgi:hypothetical protein